MRPRIWIIGMRFVQAVGGALLFANSQAILTDAFPPAQRGRSRRPAVVVRPELGPLRFP